LADLPYEWYDRNVTFPNGATVEFALRAPNGRWVPIDSKWTATQLLNQLGQATDSTQQNALRMLVQREVINRAKEAMKYLDKNGTLGFCIVAVPDTVFELCVDIQAKLTGANIVLISYSLLVPYLLLLVNLYLKEEQASRVLEFSNILSRSTSKIELIQDYINRKVIPPLHIASQQQTNYGVQIQGIQDVHARLSHIQSDLNLLKSMVNPVPNTDISSIPNTLQRYLTQVQEGLLEAMSKQNEQNPDGITK
jgi:DNA recombination protein RmuC